MSCDYTRRVSRRLLKTTDVCKVGHRLRLRMPANARTIDRHKLWSCKSHTREPSPRASIIASLDHVLSLGVISKVFLKSLRSNELEKRKIRLLSFPSFRFLLSSIWNFTWRLSSLSICNIYYTFYGKSIGFVIDLEKKDMLR